MFKHTNTQSQALCTSCCVVTERFSLSESDLANVPLCQAGPSEASGKEGQGGWGLTLQGWWPGIEVVRWGSIDQQEGSQDQLVETANWSHVRAIYKAYSMDRL